MMFLRGSAELHRFTEIKVCNVGRQVVVVRLRDLLLEGKVLEVRGAFDEKP
jgi:hypothetical protein